MRGVLFDFEHGDVCVSNGTLLIGDADNQIVQTALTASRGEFKENPAIGGEVHKQLGGCVDVMWPGRMKRMLKACGVTINRIIVDNEIITIE